MTNRLNKTLIDYLVIAISPALIMTLVGSLVFFLIEVFYQGNFHGRLQYIFALFVIGTVLIGRISIEEGRDRAALFALPLGIAILLAINKFVEFQGGVLASFSFFVNCGLIGLVWWSADKLTWDCTLIDESEEDSGEGLLEAIGLDRSGRTALQEEIAPESTTSPHPNPLPKGEGTALPGWWDHFAERRRRPHAPGVWVVYFSLAAVALFGIGQMFIPVGDLAARQSAFFLLCVYTASGLGLLLTTSFLGLRRYLRQRHQEMPLLMINLWLVLGVTLIIVVMFSAMLLPRPNPEYAISEPPFHIGSPDQKPSPHGVGRDGVKEKQPWARSQPMKEKPTGTAPTTQAKSSQNPSKPSDDRQTREDQKQGDSQSTSEKSQQSKTSPDTKKDASGSPPTTNDSSQKVQNSPDANRGSYDTQPLRAFQPLKVPIDAPAFLMDLCKWFIYGILALAAIFWIWSARNTLLNALRNFFLQLANFWSTLFGRTYDPADPEMDKANPTGAPLRRFADFTDPFASGLAATWPTEELVRYTFEALEAWARERGYPRQKEQTPHEFARCLASNVPSLADDAGRLADLYSQVAYAPGTLPAASTTRLSQLWQNLAMQTGGSQN